MDWIFRSAHSTQDSPTHPYYPTTLILPTYEANDRDISDIATEFGVLWAIVLGSAWVLATRYSPTLSAMDKFILLWFVLCGTMHMCFEGYFVLNHTTFAGKQNLFAQLWKEYALSDSRYISGDMFVLCAETITVIVWGPLSFMTAIAIAKSSPWRHPLQTIVSFGHFYGDLLYLSTSLVDLYARNVSFSRPEPYYFWFYFFFLNGIWLVVPGILLYQSITAAGEAFSGWQEVSRIYQTQPTSEGAEDNGRAKVS